MDNIDLRYLPKYTFDDYKLWKGDWELLDGFPIAMSPSPKKKHQLVSGLFFKTFSSALAFKIKICDCQIYYEIDWKVENNTILRPDLLIVCNEKESDYIETVPSLIVEVLSASTHLRDRNTKFEIYRANGVKYYILANPENNKIEIFQLIDNKYQEVYITEFNLDKNCTLNVDLNSIFNK